jgi:D-3-phosphoglycerate dehydrogenase
MKLIVTTNPFGDPNPGPREFLKEYNPSYNETNAKYSKNKHHQVIEEANPDIIIAGTEVYDSYSLDLVPNLKMIARVGIGLDSVDLNECKKRNIIVSYTPDAPSNAVAELTIAQMINGLRQTHLMNTYVKNSIWSRFIGREIRSCDIGIIGMGRIGHLVASKLSGMKPRRVLINDINPGVCIGVDRCESETKLQLLCSSDIVTLHIPYNPYNKNFIAKKELALMKPDAILINTSRGGVVNENDLYEHLKTHKDFIAFTDVFENEPYFGPLTKLNNSILTPHLGSCTKRSRFGMEMGAASDVVNYILNKPLDNQVL